MYLSPSVETAVGRVVAGINRLDPGPERVLLRGLWRRHLPETTAWTAVPHCASCRRVWPCGEVLLIAERVQATFDDLDGLTTPLPPDDAPRLPDGATLAFVYPGRWQPMTLDHPYDDPPSIDVMAVHDDGAISWALALHEAPHEPGLVLMTGHESFHCFVEVPELFEALCTVKPTTVTDVVPLLRGLGAWNATPEQR